MLPFQSNEAPSSADEINDHCWVQRGTKKNAAFCFFTASTKVASLHFNRGAPLFHSRTRGPDQAIEMCAGKKRPRAGAQQANKNQCKIAFELSVAATTRQRARSFIAFVRNGSFICRYGSDGDWRLARGDPICPLSGCAISFMMGLCRASCTVLPEEIFHNDMVTGEIAIGYH